MVYHDSHCLTNCRVSPPDHQIAMISRVAVLPRAVSSGQSWNAYSHTYNTTELKYAYRFTCSKNYYGPKCDVFCKDRDDRFGHFVCDRTNGSKQCLDGWTGDYCDEGKLQFIITLKPRLNKPS